MNYKDLSLVLLRVGLGIMFLWAGLDKVTGGFSATGYLKGSTGPLASFFQGFPWNSTLDLAVTWLLVLGGVALIVGVLTRLASLGLAALMLLIYLSHFPPTLPNHLVDDHILYILGLAVVTAFGAGKIWGLGKWAEKISPWLV